MLAANLVEKPIPPSIPLISAAASKLQ